MTRFARPILLCLIALLAAGAPALAQDPPPDRGRGAMIDRLRKNLNELDLTQDQQEKVDAILGDASQQLIKLREESQGDLEKLREKAGGVFQEVRRKLQDVLTPEQQQKFQELMPSAADRRAAGPRDNERRANEPRANESRAAERDMASETKPKPGEGMEPKVEPAKPKPEPAPKVESKADPKPVVPDRFAAGTAAPDFKLRNLDGKTVALQNLRSKPTVLIFGSFSSPTFRDRVAAFEAMKKEYRSKINMLVIYTREGYANNEWDVQRNLDEQIRVTPHLDIEERTKMAKMTRDGLKISIDMLVDEMDDGVSTAYDAMPNGCVVIDGNGKIVVRQKWADAFGARNAVDEALKTK